MFIPDPDLFFLPIPDPRIQRSKRPAEKQKTFWVLVRIQNTALNVPYIITGISPASNLPYFVFYRVTDVTNSGLLIFKKILYW